MFTYTPQFSIPKSIVVQGLGPLTYDNHVCA